MALITYNPTSPARRAYISVDKSELYKGRPEKALTTPLKKTGGRNNTGRITTRHIGGGHKRHYRLIDFKRRKWNMWATVERLEHDPNRSAFIALVKYEDGEKNYILAPQKLKAGDRIIAGDAVDIVAGNALPIKNIPVGTVVHNVELKPGRGGQMARSAGASVQIVGKDGAYIQVRLGSGELRKIHETCMATIGSVSNADHINRQVGKAGRTRWTGTRPTVRGEVMNPVDHPHGGRTRGNTHPQSPWGTPAKGYKTRSPRKPSSKFIIRTRHKAKQK